MSTLDSALDRKYADDRNAVNVLIAYDDVVAAQRAMRLFARVGREHLNEFLCRAQPWRFDLLGDPDWGKCASSDALRADLIVVSTSKRSDLPVAVQNWLAECLSQKQGARAAVVALLGSEDQKQDANSAGIQFLQSAARRAGLDFFVPVADSGKEPEPARQSIDRAVRPARSALPPSRQTLTRLRPPEPPQAFSPGANCRHWGINE